MSQVATYIYTPMFGKKRRLVADEPVEFKKQPVEVQEFRKFTDHFRGIYWIYLKWMKAKPEDVNMWPVKFRITRILTDSNLYAQKQTSGALLQTCLYHLLNFIYTQS